MAFLPPNFLIAIAASPPVEVTLPAISAAVAIQTGHMGLPPHLRLVDRDTRLLYVDLGLAANALRDGCGTVFTPAGVPVGALSARRR